ncbi:MAG: hypothetical protein QM704_10325 [Anaeromyxobacteraceae bacterium]
MLVGEGDGGVLDRLGPHLAARLLAGLPRLLDVVVEQLRERLDGVREVVHPVVGPAELVDRLREERVLRVLEDVPERAGRLVERVGPRVVEVPVAEADPGLGHERAPREAVDEGAVRRDGLLALPHLAEAVREQVLHAVGELVVGEAGDDALVERDRAGVALHRLGRRLAALGQRLGGVGLLPLRGRLEVVVRLLVVELGEAEHRVGRVDRIVRVAPDELLEARDGGLALAALEHLEVADGLLVVLAGEAPALVELLLDDLLDLGAVRAGLGLEARDGRLELGAALRVAHRRLRLGGRQAEARAIEPPRALLDAAVVAGGRGEERRRGRRGRGRDRRLGLRLRRDGGARAAERRPVRGRDRRRRRRRRRVLRHAGGGGREGRGGERGDGGAQPHAQLTSLSSAR